MVKRFYFCVLVAGTLAAGLLAPRTAHAEPSQFLFVGDLKTGTLLRYNADPGASFLTPYGLNGNLSDPAYITGQGVTEGVHGTGNTLITSQNLNGTWHISRFNRFTGAFVGYVSTKTFGGIGNLALTNDATTVYVPDESGNTLYRIDVATGNVLSSTAMTGVHDVQIGADGFIYATAYKGGNGVRRYKADLSSYDQIVAPGANGLDRPAGVVVSGNNLFVAQNSQTQPSSVYRYTLNGGNAATYQTQVTSSLLSFSFGMEMGPDNNLYIAVPGSFIGAGGPNQVVKIDLTNGFSSSSPASVAIAYPGTTNSTTYTSASTNIIWPKYIKFSSNFAPANDPGALNITAAPEPGSVSLLGVGFVGMVGMIARRKAKTASK